MRPELVLDDEEKKTRFRKFLSKKAAEGEDGGEGSGAGGGAEGGPQIRPLSAPRARRRRPVAVPSLVSPRSRAASPASPPLSPLPSPPSTQVKVEGGETLARRSYHQLTAIQDSYNLQSSQQDHYAR